MEVLFQNISYITWQMLVMWGIGGVLIYLAIVKEMEPTLLLPMGFGAILVNLPIAVQGTGVQHVLDTLFSIGVNVSGQIASVIAGGLILALVKAQYECPPIPAQPEGKQSCLPGKAGRLFQKISAAPDIKDRHHKLWCRFFTAPHPVPPLPGRRGIFRYGRLWDNTFEHIRYLGDG